MLRTREYDFANQIERAEWFDIFVALVRYLLSGESKVGYLNDGRGKENPIHKRHMKKVLIPATDGGLIGRLRRQVMLVLQRRQGVRNVLAMRTMRWSKVRIAICDMSGLIIVVSRA